MNIEQLINKFELVTDTEEGLKQLRKLILNLAVRGELTKQKNTEITASKLVKNASEEKEQLYKDGEIRKPKEFDSVSEEEVSFQIPNYWEWCRLCDISIIETGKRMKGGARDEGIISLGGEHLKPDGTVDYSIPRCITEEFYDQLNRGQIEVGDILIVKDGATTGKTAFVRKLPEARKAAINEHVVLVRALSTVDKNFLFRFIQILSEEFARKHSKGVIGGVKMSQLRSFPVPFPPHEEQQRIIQKIEALFSQVDELEQKVDQDRQVDERLQVAVLDDLQRAETPEASQKSWQRLTDHFEQIYRKPEHIDQLKQAILNEAVRGRLVPQDPNDEPAEQLLERITEEKQRLYDEGEIRKPKDLPEITDEEIPYALPKVWKWCGLGDACLFITDGFHSTPNKVDEGVPFIMATQVYDGKLDFEDCYYVTEEDHKRLYNKAKPSKGDVMVVNIGGSCGKAAIVRTDMEFSFKNIAIIKNPGLLNSEYLFKYFILKRDEILNEITQGGAQPYLSLKMLRILPFPLPPLEEQHRIVNKIEELFGWCDNLKEKLSRSRQTDRRLLEALVKQATDEREESKNPKEATIYKMPQQRKKKSKVVKLSGISTTDVQAGTMARIINLYEKFPEKKEHLGRTKMEKTVHVLESHVKIDQGRKPKRMARGAADFQRLINKVEFRADKQGWFTVEDINGIIHYRKGIRFFHPFQKLDPKLGDKISEIDRIINLFIPLSTREAEVRQTVYAAWHDLIAYGKDPSDDEIVLYASTEEYWAKEKEEIPKKEFYEGIEWLKKNDLVPDGKGKITVK